LINNSLLILWEVGLVGSVENILIDEISAEYEIYFFGVIRVMNVFDFNREGKRAIRTNFSD
jgi:hypothetical protein